MYILGNRIKVCPALHLCRRHSSTYIAAHSKEHTNNKDKAFVNFKLRTPQPIVIISQKVDTDPFGFRPSPYQPCQRSILHFWHSYAITYNNIRCNLESEILPLDITFLLSFYKCGFVTLRYKTLTLKKYNSYS